MSDEGWPADPNDPRCPECGEPVSATASYCLHCYSDLPTAEDSTDDATSSTTDAETTTANSPTTTTSTSDDDTAFSPADTSTSSTDASPTATDTSTSSTDASPTATDTSTSTADASPTTTDTSTSTTDASTRTGDASTTDAATGDDTDWSSFSTTAGEAAAMETEPRTTEDDRGATTESEETGAFDPDGILDNTVTVVVALFLGTLSAVVATVMVAFPLPGSLPFYAGLVTWLVVTGHAARSPTAWEATRRGCYAFAGLLIATPVLVGITAPMQDGAVADRAAAIVFFTLFVLPVASFFGVVGFLAGRAGDG